MSQPSGLPANAANVPQSRARHPSYWRLVVLLALLLGGWVGGLPVRDTGAAVLPMLGCCQGMPAPASGGDFTLSIPRIGLHVPVVEAYIRGETWDFSALDGEAGHLELTAYPGQGTNIAVGAHYELADFSPGPFYHLDDLAVGDRLQVAYQGEHYVYEVREALIVDPTNVAVVYRTPQEMLTLLTCYNYDRTANRYASRYVVRAVLIEGP